MSTTPQHSNSQSFVDVQNLLNETDSILECSAFKTTRLNFAFWMENVPFPLFSSTYVNETKRNKRKND